MGRFGNLFVAHSRMKIWAQSGPRVPTALKTLAKLLFTLVHYFLCVSDIILGFENIAINKMVKSLNVMELQHVRK